MKFIVESNEEDSNVFDELKELRELIGDDIILDEMIEELSYQRLEEFVAYIKRRYKSIIDEWKPTEEDD